MFVVELKNDRRRGFSGLILLLRSAPTSGAQPAIAKAARLGVIVAPGSMIVLVGMLMVTGAL
jgi:hypothetical protein